MPPPLTLIFGPSATFVVTMNLTWQFCIDISKHLLIHDYLVHTYKNKMKNVSLALVNNCVMGLHTFFVRWNGVNMYINNDMEE